jgi:transposase
VSLKSVDRASFSAAWRQLRKQITIFDKAVQQRVKSGSDLPSLMTVPGIGALSSLMYVSTVEDPGRFARSRAVGAHLGLTPRRYQSGETDRSGHISRCGEVSRARSCARARWSSFTVSNGRFT